MIEWWHLWVVAGVALWILEIFTPGFVAGVFGTACWIAAPFAGAGASITVQLLVFGMATAVLTLAIRPLILKCFSRSGEQLKTNMEALVGRTGLVTEPIDPAAGTGQVKIGGELWRAVTRDEVRVDAGVKVGVIEVEGCKVIVHVTQQ